MLNQPSLIISSYTFYSNCIAYIHTQLLALCVYVYIHALFGGGGGGYLRVHIRVLMVWFALDKACLLEGNQCKEVKLLKG